jgi:predicted hydrocarbon binding protein
MGDAAFRALPLEQRLDLGLQALASLFSHFTDQASSVSAENNTFVFRVDVSPFAWGRTSDKPVCHALIGVVQECLSWASNGYEFHVWETNCRACGADACTFRVNKTPIGEKAG